MIIFEWSKIAVNLCFLYITQETSHPLYLVYNYQTKAKK